MRPSRSFSVLFGVMLGTLLFVLSTYPLYAASPIFVKPGGTGNGSDWDNAASLQSAISAATSGDEVWVATGIYTPGLPSTNSFVLPHGAALFGGFAGTETQLSERDRVANPTVLSGDLGGDDSTDANGVVTTTTNFVGTNSVHVIKVDGTSSDVTDSTRLDGFTVTAGNAAGNMGGGMLCDGHDGGECSPHIENVIFSGNFGNNGGALANYAENNPTSCGSSCGRTSPTLINVTFDGNSAVIGGAILNDSGLNGENYSKLTNVVFTRNTATWGGAISNGTNSGGIIESLLVNVTFAGNSASSHGGAIDNSSDNSVSSPLLPTIKNGILWGNTAPQGAEVYNVNTGLTLQNSLVEGGYNGTNVVNIGDSVSFSAGGDLDADPLFVDQAAGNVRLSLGSPALDTGKNSLVDVSVDRDGDPRKADGDGNGSITVDMGAYELQAAFLTLTLVNNGSGTVERDPLGSSCPTCTALYLPGTSVTFTATADTGSTFNGWAGDCGGSDPCQLTMENIKLVYADFSLNTYPLTVTLSGSGNGTVNKDPNQIEYSHGTTVTLTAVADIGSSFNAWSGDCTGEVTNVCELTFDAAKNVTATFDRLSYPLVIHPGGTGSGTVAKTPDQANYPFNSTVFLTPTAAIGSSFTGWGDDCEGYGTLPCHLNIDTSPKVTANFTLNLYFIDISTTGEGSGTVSKDPDQPSYLFGSTVDLTAHPASGSTFSGWSGACTNASGECHLTMSEDKTVTAHFTQNSYTLTVITDGEGTVSQTPDQATYPHGFEVTLNAVPATGYTFTGWSGACTNTSGDCLVTMTEAKTVTAHFTQNSYTLTVITDGEGTVSKSPDEATYLHGTEVTLTASVADGFIFTGWSGACTDESGDCKLTMTSDMSVTATFEEESGPGNHAPGILSSPGLTATVGVPYTYEITALDPDLGDVLTISAPTIPAWLTLTQESNNSATLSGVPAADDIGENAVQLLVEDGDEASNSQSFTITVSISQTTVPTGTVQGTVLDQAGVGVPSAEVTLNDEGGAQSSEVIVAAQFTDITDANGNYVFEGVPVGDYTLTVHIEGKKDYTVPVTVTTGQTTSVPDITLLPTKFKVMLPALSRKK